MFVEIDDDSIPKTAELKENRKASLVGQKLYE